MKHTRRVTLRFAPEGERREINKLNDVKHGLESQNLWMAHKTLNERQLTWRISIVWKAHTVIYGFHYQSQNEYAEESGYTNMRHAKLFMKKKIIIIMHDETWNKISRMSSVCALTQLFSGKVELSKACRFFSSRFFRFQLHSSLIIFTVSKPAAHIA